MARAESNPLDFGGNYDFDAISAPSVDITPTAPRGAPPQSAARRPVSGGSASNLGAAYEYFLSKGFAPHQAAGIVGNIAQESGGHTGAHGDLSLPGGGSIGIAQWNRERLHGGGGYTGLLPFAQAQGMDPKDLYTQLDYMMHEMKGPERKALQNVMAARNVEEATRAFGEGYERPNAKHANYENRIAQANRFLGARGDVAEQQPQGDPADFQRIPLSNGKILTVPKDVDRQQAINDLRSQGMDVEGMTPHPLTNGKTLHLPDSADVNAALVDLQKQQPDQEWMTKTHAEKSGVLPAAKAAAAGLGSTLLRGPSEWIQEIPALKGIGTAGIEKSKEWSKYAQETAEAPLPTDPLSQKIKYYGGTAVGGFGPFVAGAALAPEAVAPALLGGTMASSATGSLAQRFDEQKQDFSPLEHIPAIAGETALQYGTTAVLGPLRQFVKSPALDGLLGKEAAAHVDDLIKTQGFDAAKAVVGQRVANVAKEAGINISSMAAGDVASMAIERVSAGQSLSDKSFKEELENTLATDLMGGAVMGPVSGVMRQGQMERAYDAKAREAAAIGPQPELPPPGAAAPSEGPTPPPGGVSPEGPTEALEDIEARVRQYPRREAPEEQPPVAEAPPIVEAPPLAAEPLRTEEPPPVTEEEIPEPKVRKTPGAWFKEVTGLGGNTGVAKRFKASELDIDNPEHHQGIVDLIKGEEGQKATAFTDEHAANIVGRINEQRLGAGLEPIGTEYAQQISEAGAPDGRSSTQPIIREEGRDQTIPSEGVEPSGQGIKDPEVKAPKEVKFAKAEEPKQIKSAIGNKGTFDTTKPDIREARGVAPEAAHSVETLNDHIAKTYGKEAPQVDVLTREQAGVEPDVKGFYDPNTKRVTLVADNIGKGEDVHGLMRHEVAVHAKRLGKNDAEFQSILDRLQKLKDSGNAEVMRAYARVPKDTNPEHIHEEALAYLSQHAPKLPIVKQFTSWIRRTAHKITGSSNWLKSEDFAPMADAILKKGEVTPRASKERMYMRGDAHEQAAQSAAATHRGSWWDRTKEGLEHKYTKIQTAAISSKAALTYKLGQQEMYGANGEIRAKAKVDQATHIANMVGESYDHGFITRNAQGLNEVVHDDNLALNKWRDRFSAVPEHLRDSFENAIDTLAKAGHNLRLSEHMETLKEGKEQLKLADARRTEIIEEMAMLRRHDEEAPPRYLTLKAQKEFLTEEIADRKKLADMIEDRYTRAQRSDGKLFDVSDEEVAAARSLIDSTPETKELAKHLRKILHNDAKLLRDNQVISDAAYEKFTDPKYDYAPRYMQMEDLAEHLPASETYGAGLRSSAAPKKIRGGQHDINLLENLFAHRAKMTTMALHNNARLGALKELQALGEATPLAANARPTRRQPTIDVMEGGKRRYYEVPDRALLEAFEIIQHMPIKFLTTSTKVASKYMLMNPGYLYRQLWREPIMAAATSGMGLKAGLSMPFSTVKTLASLMLHKTGNDHILFDQLRAQGVTASHNYLKDYVQEMGKPYAEPTTKLGKAQEKAKGFIKAMEHAHELVDGATKVAVMKRLKAQAESGELTGTPLHGNQARDAAISKVASIINMQQRGRSAGMHYLTQTTPFFNSWAQGMDSILRSATGHGMTAHEAKRARQSFWAHAAALTAFSTASAIAMSMYSEKYRKARPEDYLNNWVMPLGDRLLKGAAPFELTVFKTIPEMLVRRAFGLDRGVENSKLAEIGIWRNILPPGADSLGIPFIVKPIGEALAGHEFKYWGNARDIGNQNIAPEIRGRGKSAYADILSDLTGISPAAISHVTRGYAPELDTAINTMSNLSAAVFSSKKGRELTRDMTEVVPFLHNIVTNPTKLDTSIEDFNAEQKMLKATGKYMQRRGMEGAREYIKEGRYSKAAGNLEEAIAKTNIRLERLRNSEDFKDAEEAQRKADALRARSEQLHERMIELKERKKAAED